MTWIPGTRQIDNYVGITVRPEGGDPRRDAFYAVWPLDATASEVADALTKMASSLRKEGDRLLQLRTTDNAAILGNS